MLEYWNVGNNHPPSLFHYSTIPLFQVPLRQAIAFELIHGPFGGSQRLFGTDVIMNIYKRIEIIAIK